MTKHESTRNPPETRTVRLTFDAATLRKRLKLPSDAVLTHASDEFPKPFDRLVVTYEVTL
jgi:hypothetical protein